MNDDSILGSALGQLGQLGKQAVKQVVKIPEEMAKDTAGQVGGSAKQNEAQAASAESDSASGEPRWQSDKERVKFLKDLYGKSDMSKDEGEKIADKSASFAKASAAKPEEQKKLLELRNQLHKENYYDPTFNPVKKQEERPAEKVEHEKKKEMADLQKKEDKKPPPLAVVREQNKTEMFRGTAG